MRWGISWEETYLGLGTTKVKVFYSSQSVKGGVSTESTAALECPGAGEKEGRVVLYQPYNTTGNAAPGAPAPKKPNP